MKRALLEEIVWLGFVDIARKLLDALIKETLLLLGYDSYGSSDSGGIIAENERRSFILL